MSNEPRQYELNTVNSFGHRVSLRERLIENPIAVDDRELLELVLFTSINRRDVKQTARRMILKFGSFASTVLASPEEFSEFPRVNKAVIASLKTVVAGAIRLAESSIPIGTRIDRWDQVSHYLLTKLSHQRVEHVVLFYLDKRNRLLKIEDHEKGFSGDVDFDIRRIIAQGLRLNATNIIISHNHPSGDVKPSPRDVRMTEFLECSLASFGLRLMDHIIVGNGACFSFREEGHIGTIAKLTRKSWE